MLAKVIKRTPYNEILFYQNKKSKKKNQTVTDLAQLLEYSMLNHPSFV